MFRYCGAFFGAPMKKPRSQAGPDKIDEWTINNFDLSVSWSSGLASFPPWVG